MEAEEFDEAGFFRALAENGVRYLLIGRRALVALGAPVMTADYDIWLDFDMVEKLNSVADRFELAPTYDSVEARARGRYVLEGAERVDVLITRGKSLDDGTALTFNEAHDRRVTSVAFGVEVALPCLEDLITTKRWGARPKDALDIVYLQSLARRVT
jgi:hypothetical protein